jgi:hypothetical protein
MCQNYNNRQKREPDNTNGSVLNAFNLLELVTRIGFGKGTVSQVAEKL